MMVIADIYKCKRREPSKEVPVQDATDAAVAVCATARGETDYLIN